MLFSRTDGIECRGLTKLLTNHGRELRIDVPELAVPPGTCAAVVGPNGDGKTSLLRLLAGVISADAGQVRLRRPAIVFTNIERQFHHRMTARENVRYLSALFGSPVPRDPAIAEALERTGLAELRDSRVSRLSKGQKVRLALAILSLAPWRTVILDEPSNGLDPDGLDLLVATLAEAKANGAAMIMSTHDKDLIARSADMIVRRTGAGRFCSVPTVVDEIESIFEVAFIDGTTTMVRRDALLYLVTGRLEQIRSISNAGLQVGREA